MLDHQIVNAVGTESCPPGIREEQPSIPARRFAEPGFQDGHGRFGQGRAPLLAAFPNDPHMRARPQRHVVAGQAGHFGEAKPGLHRRQEECVIAPAEPGPLIGCGQQRLDLRPCE